MFKKLFKFKTLIRSGAFFARKSADVQKSKFKLAGSALILASSTLSFITSILPVTKKQKARKKSKKAKKALEKNKKNSPGTNQKSPTISNNSPLKDKVNHNATTPLEVKNSPKKDMIKDLYKELSNIPLIKVLLHGDILDIAFTGDKTSSFSINKEKITNVKNENYLFLDKVKGNMDSFELSNWLIKKNNIKNSVEIFGIANYIEKVVNNG